MGQHRSKAVTRLRRDPVRPKVSAQRTADDLSGRATLDHQVDRGSRLVATAPVRRLTHILEGALTLTVVIGLIGVVGVVAIGRPRLIPPPSIDTTLEVGGDRTLAELKDRAASRLEAAVASGGGGYTFEVVQRSTVKTKPGGPKIEVPDPDDRTRTLGLVDEYYLNAIIERGAVTPDGFWMEMRTGPAKGAEPDWKAAYHYGAIATGGTIWRDDGEGWYETDSPPGIGLDPRTASLLPAMLRNAARPADAGTESVKGEDARKLTAAATKADIPGIVAVDGESFTEFRGPAELAFDDEGRLVLIRILALNTNLVEFDLEVETVITLGYPPVADPLPKPEPLLTDMTPFVKP